MNPFTGVGNGVVETQSKFSSDLLVISARFMMTADPGKEDLLVAMKPESGYQQIP